MDFGIAGVGICDLRSQVLGCKLWGFGAVEFRVESFRV